MAEGQGHRAGTEELEIPGELIADLFGAVPPVRVGDQDAEVDAAVPEVEEIPESEEPELMRLVPVPCRLDGIVRRKLGQADEERGGPSPPLEDRQHGRSEAQARLVEQERRGLPR